MKKIIIIILILLGVSADLCYSQIKTIPEKSQEKIYSNFPIVLSIEQAKPDQLGTDIKNIYTITVDFQLDQYRNKNTYTLMYYLDSVAVGGFKNQTLPYSITRNYKGQSNGVHEVKINVEDGQGHVLATSSIPVRVEH